MGIEDLEPEFAHQIREDHISLILSMQDIERLKRDIDLQQFKNLEMIKEEITKFRDEIKSALNEHLAFIQEIHNEIEKDRRAKAEESERIRLQI